jgi:outer membrane protein insertion porin family
MKAAAINPRFENHDRYSDVNVDDYKSELQFENGDWYNADKVEKTVTALTDALGKKGFAFLMFSRFWLKIPKTAKLILPLISVKAVAFLLTALTSAATPYHDEVIRREFRIEEGDAFNALKSKIRAAMSKIWITSARSILIPHPKMTTKPILM